MRLVSLAIVMSLALLLAFLSDASGGEKKKKKKGNAVKGSITKVERGKEEGTATLTVKLKAKKGQEAKEVKLEIAKDTKIEKGSGKKKDKTPPVASEVSALEQGQQITAQRRKGSETVVDKVLISAKKKKKNK